MGQILRLGDGVKDLGVWLSLVLERHESRRIDNQLRGRSGRQGDPGYSRFYLSADDELMVRFGGETFKQRMMMLERLNASSNEPLSSKIFTRFVTNAQKRIEGNNYDARKNVLKYDDVLRKQREIIYKERRDVLLLESIEPQVLNAIQRTLTSEVKQYTTVIDKETNVDTESLFQHITNTYFKPDVLTKDMIENHSFEEIQATILDLAHNEMQTKKENTPDVVYNEFLKVIMLRVIDTYWTQHIDTMSELRQGVSLQSYGQNNPLTMYQQEGLRLFNTMVVNISKDVTRFALRAHIQMDAQREAVVKNTSTNQGQMDAPKKPRKPKVRRNRNMRGRPFNL